MKTPPLFALAAVLGSCSTAPAEKATADKPTSSPIQEAVIAYLKKNLDDPASYAPARWGMPTAWRQQDANKLAAKDAYAKAELSRTYAKQDEARSVRMIRNGATKAQLRPIDASFNQSVVEVKRFQAIGDSLQNAVDTTRLATHIVHAYRAKNKLGAVVLDSTQFLVYKSGKVERL